MSPPGSTCAEPVPRVNRESSRKAVRREFARALHAHGFDPSPFLVAHMSDKFLADGFTNPAHVVDYLLWYSDPTGDTATARVMRTAARR